jgi:uncharacterized membrane protein
MGMSWAEHTVEIAAPVETSFEAITDYESFPRWQDAVDSVEVLDRTKDGLGQKVKLHVDAKVRKIDYTLNYRYQRPNRIEWDFVEGNGMNDVDGVYTLEEISPDRSRATYKLGADPAIPVPGPVARRVHKQLVKRSVEDLKTEAERRHAAAESAPAAPKKRFGIKSKPADWTSGNVYEEVASGAGPSEPAGSDEQPAVRTETGSDAAPGPGPVPETGLGSLSSLPVVGGVAGRARAVTGGAARAGLGVVRSALEVAADAAERLDRKLSGEDKHRRD